MKVPAHHKHNLFLASALLLNSVFANGYDELPERYLEDRHDAAEEDGGFEDDQVEEDGGFEYDDDAYNIASSYFSGQPYHHLKYQSCMRLRGGAWGDSKTYNNPYLTYQYDQYVTYHSCKKNGLWGLNAQCQSKIDYMVPIENYFESTASCVNNYCEDCYATCGISTNSSLSWSAQRCFDKCTANCDYYYEMTENAYTDGFSGCSLVAGTYYYYGTTCTDDGSMQMGYYQDNSCKVKVKNKISTKGTNSTFLSFDVFKFVDSICMNCTSGGSCEEVYDSSFHCNHRNGSAITSYEYGEQEHNEGDEVCYTAYKSRTRSTSKKISHSRARRKAFRSVMMSIIVGAVSLVAVFLSVSYMYFIRHCAWDVMPVEEEDDEDPNLFTPVSDGRMTVV